MKYRNISQYFHLPTLLPALLVLLALLFSSWLMFHTFSYDNQSQSFIIARKVWSDFGAHLPLIRSFSLGDNFSRLLSGLPPEYPLFPGQPIRYHFLFYALVGLLERAGLRIDLALNIPSIIGFLLLVVAIIVVAQEVFKDYLVTFLSLIFFLFNGSLSFLNFFANHPLSWATPRDILTNRDFPSFGPWDGGDITAFWNLNIYTNQRHLALAMASAFWFIYASLKAEKWSRRRQSYLGVAWGLVIGLFPFFHQPTLLIFAIIMTSYFLLFPKMRVFLVATVAVTLVVALPQLWWLASGSQGVTWYPGYLINTSLSVPRFVSFWWQNLGYHSFLIPLGFLALPTRAKKIILPSFLLFAIANLFKFSPEVAANHKFFNFALILGQMDSAYFLVRYARELSYLKNLLVRLALSGLLVIFLVFTTLSGVIDLMAIKNDSRGKLPEVGGSEVVTWIAQNTTPAAVFLNHSYLYHPASLAGRKVFLGWPYFAWSAGYNTQARLKELVALYNDTDYATICNKLRQYRISYITLGSREKITEISPNTAWWEKHFRRVFESSDKTFTIYSSEPCEGG